MFSDFKKLVPEEFKRSRQKQYKAFQSHVGGVLRRYRDVSMPGTNDKIARQEKWKLWFGQIEFDVNWRSIRKVDDAQAADMMRGKGSSSLFLAVYYRLHSLLDEPKWADEIDQFVFRSPLRNKGVEVFIKEDEFPVVDPVPEQLNEIIASQETLVRDNAQLKEQVDMLTMMFREHLLQSELRRPKISALLVKAGKKVAASDHEAADKVLLKAIDLVYRKNLAPSCEQIARIQIERARNLLLTHNVIGALSAYREALALPFISRELALYCQLCSFAALSFDKYLNTISIRFPARLFVFEDNYEPALRLAIARRPASGSTSLIFPDAMIAVNQYYNGVDPRSWSMSAENAGDQLMDAAKDLGLVVFADLALMGFEYMAFSYQSADDPIDVQNTIIKRIRAIEFLKGNRSPSSDDLKVENIYRYI